MRRNKVRWALPLLSQGSERARDDEIVSVFKLQLLRPRPIERRLVASTFTHDLARTAFQTLKRLGYVQPTRDFRSLNHKEMKELTPE
ncbi:hypothetical protein P3T76_012098 [Phytophthora citrophthora]|uniref:Uncharacterized protein n=1 Tax=Phytophthora citrophthora TaxID=4793 RepID=A0AAD9LED5_9STRA|nr:hypothetical protein P3T76_012098 [Phytophthora citrophthora]